MDVKACLVEIANTFFARGDWEAKAAGVAKQLGTDTVIEVASAHPQKTCVIGALAVLAYHPPSSAGLRFVGRSISPNRHASPDPDTEWFAARVVARWAKKDRKARNVFRRALFGENGGLAEAVVYHYDQPSELIGELGRIKTTKGVVAVLALATNHPRTNPYSPSDVSRVVRLLSSPDEEIRRQAGRWLATFATPQNASHVLPALREAMANETVAGVRKMLVRAIRAAGG